MEITEELLQIFPKTVASSARLKQTRNEILIALLK